MARSRTVTQLPVPSTLTAPTNPVLLQGFTWDLPADGTHWRLIADNAILLAATGVTSMWLPPAYKGHEGINDVGYGVYDLYDLGEFDQKGSVATKYGTKDEYIEAVKALHDAGIVVLADIVFNHRMGADATEEVVATPVDPKDRYRVLGPPETITAWTRFTFPGRDGAYSDFTWNWRCFKGTDWDEATGRNGVWLFEGKQWHEQVAEEHGNFDYLMGADVHLSDPAVAHELQRWGQWFLETTGVDGLRLDAVKHIGRSFFRQWLPELRRATGKALPTVGEYWTEDIDLMMNYLGEEPIMDLFDSPLHHNFYLASCSEGKGGFDLSCMFVDTVVQVRPENAITFVENHDTQPGQALESYVEPWFKPSAYALILLRDKGVPCVFWGDLFGTPETGDIPAVTDLPLLMRARRSLAHGPQHDYIDSPECIGFTREGDDDHPASGLAVLISDRCAAAKRMRVGTRHAGQTWVCVIGEGEDVVIDEDGTVEVSVTDSGLSLYAPIDATGILQRALEHLARVC